MTIQKSRNIPLMELYSALQMEFISYYLRSKIYCKDFVENYAKICDQKKIKINTISNRNNIPSIFSNENYKKRYLNKFLGSEGFPKFTYKDDDIKFKMQRWDKYYYYCKGTSVSFKDLDDNIILGVIEHNDKNNSIVILIDEFGESKTFHYNNITRLFPENFFNFN